MSGTKNKKQEVKRAAEHRREKQEQELIRKLPAHTQPAEERGERLASAKQIATGGKSSINSPKTPEGSIVPADVDSDVVTPPAPPGESAPEAVQKTRAVVDVLTELGENADAKQVADTIRARSGIDIDPAEVATIRATLRERAKTPPGPDQPPPPDLRDTPSLG
jgi:hypothetical protein